MSGSRDTMEPARGTMFEFADEKFPRMSHVAPQSKTDEPPRAHRPGVIHFLLWMLGCAAAMTGYRVFTDWSLVAAENAPLVRLGHLGVGMAYGVGVVTAYVLLCSLWRRDGAFPAHPGHWMLLLGLAAALLDGVMTLIVRACFAAAGSSGGRKGMSSR